MRVFNEEAVISNNPEVILVLNKAEANTLIEALTEASQKYKRKSKFKNMLKLMEEKICIF